MSAATFPLRGDKAVSDQASAAMPAAPWRAWLRRIRARRALAMLHPEQVREAGLDPATVRAEMLKPFWRA